MPCGLCPRYLNATPDLLADNGYQNRTNSLNKAMQRAFNAPGKAPYEIFGSMPQSAKSIGMLLSAMGIQKPQRIENIYPIQERVVDGFDSELSDTLFVDVGAGHGHMVARLRAAMSQLPGRKTFPNMINTAPQAADIVMQAYDFFTEQPTRSKTFTSYALADTNS